MTDWLNVLSIDWLIDLSIDWLIDKFVDKWPGGVSVFLWRWQYDGVTHCYRWRLHCAVEGETT